MRVIPVERSNLAQSIVVFLVMVVVLVSFSVMMAHWTWVWLAPHPEGPALQKTEVSTSINAAYGLFGRLQINHQAIEPTGIAMRLLGIVTAEVGHRGYALVKLEEKETIAVLEGEEIYPGVRLAEVGTDHLILERNGTREILALPRTNLLIESINEVVISGK